MYVKHGSVVLQADVKEVPLKQGTMKASTATLSGPYGRPMAVDVVAFGRPGEALLGGMRGSVLAFEGTLETRAGGGQNRPRLVVKDVLGLTPPGEAGGDLQKVAAAFEKPLRVPGWDNEC